MSTTLWIGGAAGLAVLVAIGCPRSGGTTEQGAIVVAESSVRAVGAIAAGILLGLPVVLVWRGRGTSDPWNNHSWMLPAARCTVASKK